MAVGHLLLQSLSADPAIFQLRLPVYVFFLLLKIEFVQAPEYRQPIKTFRLKYIFPASKTIRTAKCADEINLTWKFGTTNLRKLA